MEILGCTGSSLIFWFKPTAYASYDALVHQFAGLHSGFLQTFPHGIALALG
jgi:hypothetical protein